MALYSNPGARLAAFCSNADIFVDWDGLAYAYSGFCGVGYWKGTAWPLCPGAGPKEGGGGYPAINAIFVVL